MMDIFFAIKRRSFSLKVYGKVFQNRSSKTYGRQPEKNEIIWSV